LLQVEANVPRLPVPASDALPALLEQIANGPDVLPMPPAPPARSWSWRLLTGAALAASLLIGCGIFLGNVVWRALQNPQNQRALAPVEEPEKKASTARRPAPAATLVAHLVQCDLRLARAGNPEERVRALADLAQSLQGETQLLAGAAGAKELERLARLYGKVIRQGVVIRSRAVPAPERQRVLAPIVAQLARAEHDTAQLADKTPASAGPLRLIAAAAREGESQLRQLIGKDT
jgi:hypothetical protein